MYVVATTVSSFVGYGELVDEASLSLGCMSWEHLQVYALVRLLRCKGSNPRRALDLREALEASRRRRCS